VDDVRIPVARDGIHAAGNPRTELLEAATTALRWFDLFDQHAPSDMIFGVEAEVRDLLRDAIRRASAEAEDRDWDDAEDLAEAEALDALRRDLGRAPTERERLAFLNGFRERRAQLLGRVRSQEAPAAR
jgi:hypothetical protein